MDPLELLKGRNRHVKQLPSGLWCKGALPRVEECMAAGGVPLPLVMRYQRAIRHEAVKTTIDSMRMLGPKPDESQEQFEARLRDKELRMMEAEPPDELSADEQRRIVAYQNELVRRFLRALGETRESVDVPDEQEIEATDEMVAELDEGDWQQIVLWAGRDQPIDPKALTSTDSSPSSDPPQDVPSLEPSASGDGTPPPA